MDQAGCFTIIAHTGILADIAEPPRYVCMHVVFASSEERIMNPGRVRSASTTL